MTTKPTKPPAPIGRPPITDAPLVSRQVSLTDSQWAKVHKLGGSYSAGVRLAVDAMPG